MTLFWQINTLFTTILILVLATVLSISFIDSKHYIQNELFSNAQKSAKSLGLMMTKAEGNIAAMSVIADAAVKSGKLKSITLLDSSGNILFEMGTKARQNIPEWFEKITDLSNDTAFYEIYDKWKKVGILSVQVDNSSALKYLYELFKKILVTFLIAGLASMLFIYILLKSLMNPLYTVIGQADGILKNRFFYQEDIPATKELKHLAETMNGLVSRAKKEYESLSYALLKNRELEYFDPVTNVGNRRYFFVKFKEFVNAEDSRSCGVVLALRIVNVQEANRVIGFDKVDLIYKKIAAILKEAVKDIDNSLCFRVSGTEFILLLPSVEVEQMKEVCEYIAKEFDSVVKKEFIEVYGSLSVNLAISAYEPKESLKKVLSVIDFALNDSLYKKEKIAIVATKKHPYFLNKTAWRELIEESLKNGNFEPVWEDAHAIDRHKVFTHLSFNIVTKDERRISYGSYLPMLLIMGKFDKYIEFNFEFLNSVDIFRCDTISIEVPFMSLANINIYEKIKNRVLELRKRGVHIIIEVSESEILNSKDIACNIFEEFQKNGIEFAVSRFDADIETIEFVKSLRPKYLKMYVGQFVEMSQPLKDSLRPILASLNIKLLLYGVNDEHDIHLLSRQGADYFMIESFKIYKER